MPSEHIQASVGKVIRVEWSNGAGYSLYNVVDNPGSGHHIFEHAGDFEYQIFEPLVDIDQLPISCPTGNCD